MERLVEKLECDHLDRREEEYLGRHLTTGESYFLRDRSFVEMLRSHILPELLTSPSLSIDGLRAWSAGCSTGEEAYTLAVIMHEQVGQNASLRTRILGTDINADALDVARKGVYRTWSFRGT
ncbi:MAG TPA: CheR family methyltransferase, partial [Spirochaetia bacterium]|nr:CheR family methyltransferase [Spirochaetia bacterium]